MELKKDKEKVIKSMEILRTGYYKELMAYKTIELINIKKENSQFLTKEE
jgi:hypothetical protein